MQLLTPGVGLILWQLIVFVLLFILLAKFAWKPILGSLKDREVSIQEALDAADKAREEMGKLKSENEKLLQVAREERDKILREAREASNRLKEEAQLVAKKTADKVMDEARASIQVEKQAAMREVKAMVADFSLQIAEKLLKKNLAGDKAQNELVEQYLKDLKMN